MQSPSGHEYLDHQSDSTDSDEKTLKNSKLFIAIGEGKLDKVRSLLKNGAKTEITDRKNNSLLHYAVEKAKKEIVEELLNPNWKTNTNQKNIQGKTPLDIALDSIKTFSEIAQLLKNHQIEINLVKSEKHAESLTADTDSLLGNIGLEKNADEYEKSTDNSLSTFERTAGAAGIEGQLCEINLSILLLLKGTTDEQITRFHLASNLEKADKFDDIVFTCDFKTGQSKTVFLQAKHKAANTMKGVNLHSLLSDSESGDFTLNKYFITYRKIRQYFEDKTATNDPVFRGNFQDCEFLIYTNASFEYGQSRYIQEFDMDDNDLLRITQSQGKCYQLKFTNDLPEEKERIFKLLKNSSDCRRLAKALAEAVSSAKGLDIKKEIFQTYHKVLQTKLIEITSDPKGRINCDFLPAGSQFTRIFFEELAKALKKPLNSVKQELEKREINLSKKFWDENCGGCSDLPNDDPISETEVLDFLTKFKLYACQPNEKALERAIKEIAKGFYKIEQQDVDSVFADVEYQVKNWWRGENFYLTKDHKFFQAAARVSVQFDTKEPVALFTGRVQELVDLHKILQERGEAVVSQMVSITGLGGVGKSELARKYVSEHKKHYDDNIIWINAESFLTISDSFRRLAEEKLGISTVDENGRERDINVLAEDVYNFFGKRHRKSLFVFDNAQKLKTVGDRQGAEGVDKFLPKGDSNKPSVLITSRDQEWGGIQNLPLGVFTEEEAVEFIQNSVMNFLEVDKTDAQKLAKELDYLPLALRQAVAYISVENQGSAKWSKDKFTISSYLKQFEENAKKLLSEGPRASHDRYTETVLTTWKMTIDKIKHKQLRGGKLAAAMLNVMAYVAADNIPVDEIFSEEINDEEERHTAIELLDQYSMVHLDGGKVNIHRLVQKVARIELEEQGKLDKILETVFQLLQDSFPYSSDKLEDYSKKRQLLTHLETFMSHIDDWLKKKPEDREKIEKDYLLVLLEWMNDGYYANPERQKSLLERSLEIEEKYHGPDHFKVAKTLAQLGNAYSDLGYPEQQKDLLERALAIDEAHYGPNHFEVAKTLISLGNAYSDLGDPETQKELQERALAIEEEHYGPDHFELAKTLNNLGNAYGDLGDPERQKELQERALIIAENHLGPDHFKVAKVLANLGNAYSDLGDPAKQKELLERVLAIEERHLGAEHYDVAKTLINLGNANGDLGYPEIQKNLQERALGIQQKYFSFDSFELAITLGNLGNAYGALGDVNKKIEFQERALLIQEKHFGPENFAVATTLTNLSEAYGELGFLEKQKMFLERALKIVQLHFHPEHSKVVALQTSLASLAKNQLGQEFS